LTVDDQGGGTRQVTAGGNGFWKLVRVFNKEYVERSLRFDRDGKSDAAPLLVLGEEQVDREAQLKRSIDRINDIEAELATLEPAHSKSQSRLKKLATDTAKQIVEELQIAGSRYQRRRYTAAQIQTALAPGRNTFEHKSTDVAGDLQLVQGRQLSNLEFPAKRDRSVASIEATVASLLAKTVTSTTLDELRNEPAVADWVQQGIDLHEHKSDCQFCGGPLSRERRLRFESHFDQSLRQLQTELAAAELALEERRGSAGPADG
jgi:wobble nucleotide-excising tRNase